MSVNLISQLFQCPVHGLINGQDVVRETIQRSQYKYTCTRCWRELGTYQVIRHMVGLAPTPTGSPVNPINGPLGDENNVFAEMGYVYPGKRFKKKGWQSQSPDMLNERLPLL